MPRIVIFILLIVLLPPILCLVAIVLRDSGTEEEEAKTIGVILVGPRDDYGWGEVTGGEYAETTIGEDRVILFDNLNEAVYPDLTLYDVVSNMLSSGARGFFISPYMAEPEPIARKFPNTLFVHNMALRWDVEDMLPNLILVTTSRKGPPPPGTTADDITVWIFGIGGLVVAALVVLIIGILNARYQPASGVRRSLVSRLIERITQAGKSDNS